MCETIQEYEPKDFYATKFLPCILLIIAQNNPFHFNMYSSMLQ
jgi:hypothetical protein